MMEDTVETVGERLARLEVTVAEGFHANKLRFDAMDRRFDSVDRRLHEAELRDLALSHKIDVNTESLRGDIQTVLEVVNAHIEEMRRTTDSIRAEHAADRKVMMLAIEQHSGRITALEQKSHDTRSK